MEDVCQQHFKNLPNASTEMQDSFNKLSKYIEYEGPSIIQTIFVLLCSKTIFARFCVMEKITLKELDKCMFWECLP